MDIDGTVTGMTTQSEKVTIRSQCKKKSNPARDVKEDKP